MTMTRTKFIGLYTGNEVCTAGTDHYTITIAGGTSTAMSITIDNVYNQGFIVTGTVSGNNVTIPSQVTGGGSITVSGNGILSADGRTLNFTYSISGPGGSNSCTFTGMK